MRIIISAQYIALPKHTIFSLQHVIDLLVLCIIINLCLECFHCYVIIDCWLTDYCTFNKSLTYLYRHIDLVQFLYNNLSFRHLCRFIVVRRHR